jgi:hypothetical protein
MRQTDCWRSQCAFSKTTIGGILAPSLTPLGQAIQGQQAAYTVFINMVGVFLMPWFLAAAAAQQRRRFMQPPRW